MICDDFLDFDVRGVSTFAIRFASEIRLITQRLMSGAINSLSVVSWRFGSSAPLQHVTGGTAVSEWRIRYYSMFASESVTTRRFPTASA